MSEVDERLSVAKWIDNLRKMNVDPENPIYTEERLSNLYAQQAEEQGWSDKTLEDFEKNSFSVLTEMENSLYFGHTDIASIPSGMSQEDFEKQLQLNKVISPGKTAATEIAAGFTNPINAIPISRAATGGLKGLPSAMGVSGAVAAGDQALREWGGTREAINPQEASLLDIVTAGGVGVAAPPVISGIAAGAKRLPGAGAITNIMNAADPRRAPAERMAGLTGGNLARGQTIADELPSAAAEQVNLLGRSYDNPADFAKDAGPIMARARVAHQKAIDEYGQALEESTGTGNFLVTKAMRSAMLEDGAVKKAVKKFQSDNPNGPKYIISRRAKSGDPEYDPEIAKRAAQIRKKNKANAKKKNYVDQKIPQQPMVDRLGQNNVAVRDWDEMRRYAREGTGKKNKFRGTEVSNKMIDMTGNKKYKQAVSDYAPKMQEIEKFREQEKIFNKAIGGAEATVGGRIAEEQMGGLTLPIRRAGAQLKDPTGTRFYGDFAPSNYAKPLRKGDPSIALQMMTDPNAIAQGRNRLAADRIGRGLIGALGINTARVPGVLSDYQRDFEEQSP